MEDSEIGIRKKLEKSRNKISENSRKMNKELDRLRLEEVENVAKEIASLFLDGIPDITFGQILGILAKYQKKKEGPILKLMERESERRKMELLRTRIDDPDYVAKASVALLQYGIILPGMEELEKRKKRIIKKGKKI